MRCLIIEDDQDANDILAEICRERQFDTIQTYTGEEGLNSARRRNPDVILLDLMLPDLDGYSVCEQLKLDRMTNPIPVVMVTALSAEENRVRGYRVGADAYVAKPYRVEEIDRAIESALAHRENLASDSVKQFLRLDLSSDLANVQSINEFFGIALQHTPLSERELNQLRTALREMCQNAIEWGNKKDANKKVEIHCCIKDDTIQITVTDEGEGFDPRNVPHAADDTDDDTTRHFAVREMLGLREGGFGMMLAKGLVDDIKYNDRGNSVTLVKRF